ATPCCSANRSQRSSAITSIRLETERFSNEAICSSLFRCSSRTVRLSFGLFLFFLDFAIGSFLHLVLHSRSRRLNGLLERVWPPIVLFWSAPTPVALSGCRGLRFPTNRRFHDNLNFFENSVSSFP